MPAACSVSVRVRRALLGVISCNEHHFVQARCPITRAQFGSGMRDCDARAVTLPPEFTEPAARACLDYLYNDTADVTEVRALFRPASSGYLPGFKMCQLQCWTLACVCCCLNARQGWPALGLRTRCMVIYS